MVDSLSTSDAVCIKDDVCIKAITRNGPVLSLDSSVVHLNFVCQSGKCTWTLWVSQVVSVLSVKIAFWLKTTRTYESSAILGCATILRLLTSEKMDVNVSL